MSVVRLASALPGFAGLAVTSRYTPFPVRSQNTMRSWQFLALPFLEWVRAIGVQLGGHFSFP
jgi:hypothetical protein